mmetsp:Transcript_12908/g.24828  ORF Transcript_12908/g.24828 Transcript_12908/m.24828 type:complete len:200 (+) Transcript_12908:881-1480(+)
MPTSLQTLFQESATLCNDGLGNVLNAGCLQCFRIIRIRRSYSIHILSESLVSIMVVNGIIVGRKILVSIPILNQHILAVRESMQTVLVFVKEMLIIHDTKESTASLEVLGPLGRINTTTAYEHDTSHHGANESHAADGTQNRWRQGLTGNNSQQGKRRNVCRKSSKSELFQNLEEQGNLVVAIPEPSVRHTGQLGNFII